MILSKQILHTVGAALLVAIVLGRSSDDAAWQGETPIDAGRLRDDVKLLHSALVEAHPGLHRYTAQPDMERAFAAIHDAIEGPLTDLEFFRRLAPLSATIKDGHTSLVPSAARQQEITTRWLLLPLRIAIVGGRLWVLSGSEGADLSGVELVAIDGVEAAELVRRLTQAEPRDGNISAVPLHRLSQGFRFNTRLALLARPRDRYVVQYRTSEGLARTDTLTGRPLPDLAALDRRSGHGDVAEPVALRFETDGIAVLRVRTFGQRIAGDLQGAFTQIVERRAPAVVIDVRDNSGGYDEGGRNLLAHLLDRPFDYYLDVYANRTEFSFARYASVPRLDRLRFERTTRGTYRIASHPNLGTQRPGSPHYGGPVYILINPGSFSTTAEFVSQARRQKRATFVGEESGGAAGGNTSGASLVLTLPASGVQAHIPMMRYDLPTDGMAADRGVIPDIPVEATIGDRLSGRDVVLERALAAARQGGRNPPGRGGSRSRPKPYN